MSTNFYFFTNDKDTKERYFGQSAELTDKPELGYKIHIAKTSGGWLPLFQASEYIQSVKDIKKVYDTGKAKIFDEYGIEYAWAAFEERVIDWNGGTTEKRTKTPVEPDILSPVDDAGMPPWIPVSHFEYNYSAYYKPFAFDVNKEYYKDSEGYEFSRHEFS